MGSRTLAALAITEVISTATSLTMVLPKYKAKCAKKDQGLLQALCFGVFRFYPTLLFIANKLLQKPLKKKDADILHLILVGIYQLKWMRIPAHAAIQETVEGATELNKIWAKSLINAILRNYERQQEHLAQAINQNEEALTAHPKWLLQKIKNAWPNNWPDIITANNTQPPLTLRVNLKKITRDAFLTLLKDAAIEAKASNVTKTALTLTSPKDLTTIPGFSEGFFSAQDEASQWIPDLLELSDHLRILDAAAAPGGKLCHILEQPYHYQEVIALDISKTRAERIEENLTRLQLLQVSPVSPASQVKIMVQDAQKIKTWWDGILFDRILLDAPCSATGVIRRHPDIKLTRQPEDLNKLTETQYNMLAVLWQTLKSGGILLYTTCSLLPLENQEIIAKFLSLHKDAVLLPIDLPFGIPLAQGQQLLPGQNDSDGFYYARIGKM